MSAYSTYPELHGRAIVAARSCVGREPSITNHLSILVGIRARSSGTEVVRPGKPSKHGERGHAVLNQEIRNDDTAQRGRNTTDY
jgi:hypothetical protein